MTVKEIYEYLDSLFPVSAACDFDNPGLLVGDPQTKVQNTLIALDCALKTVETAIANKCNLIITHHPVIYEPLKRLEAGSVPYELVRHGIAVISMHTNLDMLDGGVNTCLCEALGLKSVQAVPSQDGYLLRSGTVSPALADDFAKAIKQALGGCVKYVDGGKPIQKVLICSGSGGDFVNEAIGGGFDALVTADVKHHQFLQAFDRNISLFDAGHFNTEDVVIEPLKTILYKQFPDIKFITDHSSGIKYC